MDAVLEAARLADRDDDSARSALARADMELAFLESELEAMRDELARRGPIVRPSRASLDRISIH